LFVLLFIFFWPLCCLFFFDIRFLIAPLISSNSSRYVATLHGNRYLIICTSGLRCSGRVGSSCFTGRTRRVNLVTNPVISREWGKDREVFTTSGTYPWLFVTQIFHNGQPSKIFEVMTSTLPKGTLGSVASLLAATLYHGNPNRNHKLWNIVSSERYILHMQVLLECSQKRKK
jgi:hypothetical protein